VKADLARRIVGDFHSPADAEQASEEFDRIFREHQTPSEVPTIERPVSPIRLAKLLAVEGLAASVSESQRLVSQGSVRIDGERVTDLKHELGATPGNVLIQVGKRRFLRVVFE
jgi:tyrosyl-tRNA synthetase